MKTTRVLISGCGIAGPSLAFWLSRYGFKITVIEKADGIRRGGQPVDFKGPVHRTVLAKMGILDAVRQAHIANDDGAIVDATGRKIGTVPGRLAAGEINVPRDALATILHDLTAGTCEYIFGDTIRSLAETADGVEVTFAHAAPRTFDIVAGADGIHSNVRRLAFGPEPDYVTHLGYYYALADIAAGADDAMYNEPGKMAALNGPKSPSFFVFASDPLPQARDDLAAQKEQLIAAFRGCRWRVPELMEKIPAAKDFYMDAISRVSIDHYARGRVVLLGDAAYGNTLGGFGAGLGIVGAYVLAGELRRAEGDHATAFARYEAKFRPYASVSQKVNPGKLLAPKTRLGIKARNLLFSILAAVGPLFALVDRPATNLRLDDNES